MSHSGARRPSAPLAVRAVGSFLPPVRTKVAELPSILGLPEEERAVCGQLGIETVGVDDADATTLAERAARRALAEAGISAEELGALLVVEQRAPRTLLSSEATLLQARLGATHALTFTVGGLGCVSVTPALLTARGLLAADPELGPVLVAHGSKPVSEHRYRHPVTVNGDGGQALLLGRRGNLTIVDQVQETDGRYWDLFHVDYRGRHPSRWREECTDQPAYSFRLAVETRNRLRALLDRLLRRNGLTRADVSGFVSQNLSAGGLTFTEEALDLTLLPECRENLRTLGHLGPNDVFLNLASALEAGRLTNGDHAVLINVSPVAAWSLLLVRTGPGRDGHRPSPQNHQETTA